MYEELKKILAESRAIVFFGGAGVSTESGVPDFRSESGLYQARQLYQRSPEEMVSHSFFRHDPNLFYDYYKNHMIYPDAQPNPAHRALAKLEEMGKLIWVVTQNIDGLHQAAGSRKVFELHGTVHRNLCMKCGAVYDLNYILDSTHCQDGKGGAGWVPYCEKCGGMVKPDVVLYEEALDDEVVQGAINAIQKADTMIVGGTSLVVYPAAGLLNYFRGANLVLINKSATPYDDRATLALHDPIGEVLGACVL